MLRRIGILTGGGDCPGLNAVIRAVTRTALHEEGLEVVGIREGFGGAVRNIYSTLDDSCVSGILPLGGTILGTSNRDDPFDYPVKENGAVVRRDCSDLAVKNLERMGVEALIVAGGDGSQKIGLRLMGKGMPVVGIPKTIDNDLMATDVTFGFDTALHAATDAVDRLHSTAEAHDRVMVLEVMGRDTGWIALNAGIAGGGDVVLIPEIPFSFECVARSIVQRRRRGKKFSIVVVAEGANMPGGGNAVPFEPRRPGAGTPGGARRTRRQRRPQGGLHQPAGDGTAGAVGRSSHRTPGCPPPRRQRGDYPRLRRR